MRDRFVELFVAVVVLAAVAAFVLLVSWAARFFLELTALWSLPYLL